MFGIKIDLIILMGNMVEWKLGCFDIQVFVMMVNRLQCFRGKIDDKQSSVLFDFYNKK